MLSVAVIAATQSSLPEGARARYVLDTSVPALAINVERVCIFIQSAIPL